MNMFYMIDTSGSMNLNGCINTVNNAMPEIVNILRDISDSNYDQSEIFLSCATFDNDARWLYDTPVAVGDFQWANVKAKGFTNLGAAFTLLEQQMHSSAALGNESRHLRPAVILLSDGDPDEGWEEPLHNLQQNPWFRQAYKIAVAIGSTTENGEMRRAITEFTKPLDAEGDNIIIDVQNLHRLYEVIKLVSATVSRFGSKNLSGAGSIGDEMRHTIQNTFGNTNEVRIPAMDPNGTSFY